MKHSVLIIAYIFPPIGGSAVHRTLSFVKYLPGFDWRPVVVCGQDANAHGDGWDHSLLSQIPPDAIVIRRPFISVKSLRRWVKRMLGFRDETNTTFKEGDQGQVERLDQLKVGVADTTPRPILRQMLRWLSAIIRPVEYPLIDAGTYWALSIVPLCLGLVRRYNIDMLYSQSYPYSDHLVGLILHMLTGRPWIADFHDPWSANACFRHEGLRRRVDVFVERQVLRHATRIIAATPTYTRDFASLVPDRDPSDFHTIAVGFDEQLHVEHEGNTSTTQLPWSTIPSKITLAHVGYVFPGSAIPFLTALRELDTREASRLRVVFVGGLARPDARWLQQNPITVELVLTPRLPLDQATACMERADFALILIADGPAWKGHCPGKLYDYMRSGAPILVSGPRGDTARIVADSGTGCLLPVDDREQSVETLRALIQDPAAFKSSLMRPKSEFIARYERKLSTAHLVDLMNSSLPGRRKDKA